MFSDTLEAVRFPGLSIFPVSFSWLQRTRDVPRGMSRVKFTPTSGDSRTPGEHFSPGIALKTPVRNKNCRRKKVGSELRGEIPTTSKIKSSLCATRARNLAAVKYKVRKVIKKSFSCIARYPGRATCRNAVLQFPYIWSGNLNSEWKKRTYHDHVCDNLIP